MAKEKHGIWWTETWNFLRGCSHVSPGCAHCWAAQMAHRMSTAKCEDCAGSGWSDEYLRYRHEFCEGTGRVPMWGHGLTKPNGQWNGTVRFVAEKLSGPLHWRKPRVVFVNDCSDTFAARFEQIAAAFGVMAACPDHTFVLLTKRAKEMREWFERLESLTAEPVFACVMETRKLGVNIPTLTHSIRWPIPNVILGVSVESQAYRSRISDLMTLMRRGWRTMISFEPLLESMGVLQLDGIDYAIVGGESGRWARPCNVEWIRSLVRQCVDAGVKVGVKQLGARAYHENLYAEAKGLTRDWDSKGANPEQWPEDLRRYAIKGPREFWGV